LMEKRELLATKHPDQITRKDAHNFTVPKRCVSVREPYSAERRKAASERAKAAGYQPPVKKSGS
ncbi:immunoglobulin, partial [[Clostridium] innocuum]|nr:immunoglobulin [[Clostridium] innocuum]